MTMVVEDPMVGNLLPAWEFISFCVTGINCMVPPIRNVCVPYLVADVLPFSWLWPFGSVPAVSCCMYVCVCVH